MSEIIRFKMRYAARTLLLALTFSFIYLIAFRHPAQAQNNFPTPPGFDVEKVRRAFKGTKTEFNWVKVSDENLALYLYEGAQNSAFDRKLQKRYDLNLVKYSAMASDWSQTLVKFNQWLLNAGVDFLDHSLKQGPVQMVIDPMVDLTETNARFDFEKLEPSTQTDWWVDVWMEPTRDVDYLFGYKPVMIHEFGHFIFHSYLSRSDMIPKDRGFVNFTLGPIDEAFADAVSYEFTGEPLVGKRYDYTQKSTIEFRRALSSPAEDRVKVRQGTWDYKIMEGDDHVRGQPFRDVLIEISKDYGLSSQFQLVEEIQKKLTVPDSAVMSTTSTRAEVNAEFNQVVSRVLARYPRLTK